MNWIKEDNNIVYKISIDTICFAFNNCPDFYDGEEEKQIYKINDVDEFIKSLLITLNSEKEDGSTKTHYLFDLTFNEMVDNGEFGIEGFD